jgi:hypothetical protein
MDVTTLVIAVFGLVLSLAALCWQAATWHLSGPRVRVEMLVGATNGRQYGTVPVKEGWQKPVEDFRAQGLGERLLAAKILNVGRQATQVVGYSAGTDTGVKLGVVAAPPGTPPLPHRLEAESQVLYYLDLEDLTSALALLHGTHQQAKTVMMHAELGSGRTVSSEPVPASLFWHPQQQ